MFGHRFFRLYEWGGLYWPGYRVIQKIPAANCSRCKSKNANFDDDVDEYLDQRNNSNSYPNKFIDRS